MARTLFRVKETGDEVKGYDFDAEIKTLDEFSLEIVGSTSKVDRDGEVLDVNGWDLKNYKKNPVILASHNYFEPAIGKAKSVKIKDGSLVFKIEFPEEGVNPTADVYRKLYIGGFMRASSVGFIPKEWEDLDGKSGLWRKYIKQELLELSLVSVPANPEALTPMKGFMQAFEKGVIQEDDIRCLGLGDCLVKAVEKEVPKKQGIDREELREMIKEAIYEVRDEIKYADLIFGGVGEPRAAKGKKEGIGISKSELVELVKKGVEL